jgi:hypothetical protein
VVSQEWPVSVRSTVCGPRLRATGWLLATGEAARSTAEDLEQELGSRPATVRSRLAYLISGEAPATANRLQPTAPASVTWFGSSRASHRYDKRFNVADGLLPFDPLTLEESA